MLPARQSGVTGVKLDVVIASIRPVRVGLPVGQWFYQRAVQHGNFEVELLDLAAINLPLMNEPNNPRMRQYTYQHTKDWSAKVDAADAFVFVTPEYNHGMPPALKNAIDYLSEEWMYKPVGFVSYGGVSAGTRAVQQLKQVVVAQKMMPMFEGVAIPFVTQLFDDKGQFHANEVMEYAAVAMLEELHRWAAALQPLRTRRA
jgi:NAD(P)H-dependent FMN reductase